MVIGERAGEVVEAVCAADCGGLLGVYTPVTLEEAVGECCWSVTVLQRDEVVLQRDETMLQRDEAEMRLAAEWPKAEAAALTEGWLPDAMTPVEANGGATGGRMLSARPRRWLRKRGADVAFPDRLSRLEKWRRLVTPAWGPASEVVEADPPE